MKDYASGSSFIYEFETAAGEYAIELTSQSTYATFNLRIEMFRSKVPLSAVSKTVCSPLRHLCSAIVTSCWPQPMACMHRPRQNNYCILHCS